VESCGLADGPSNATRAGPTKEEIESELATFSFGKKVPQGMLEGTIQKLDLNNPSLDSIILSHQD